MLFERHEAESITQLRRTEVIKKYMEEIRVQTEEAKYVEHGECEHSMRRPEVGKGRKKIY